MGKILIAFVWTSGALCIVLGLLYLLSLASMKYGQLLILGILVGTIILPVFGH